MVEVDFHHSGESYSGHYDDMIWSVYDEALDALREAQEDGAGYILFRHGSSTSYGRKQRTARSMVRRAMQSPTATPYILRRDCIQHDSVFVAAIRPRNASAATSSGTLSSIGGAIREERKR